MYFVRSKNKKTGQKVKVTTKGGIFMKISEKIMMLKSGLIEHGPINIVILGDSVSHGALYGTIDYESVYWNRLRKKLNAFRDYVPVNMICAAISATRTKDALERLDRQVLSHEPDLVIVCYGLNDINDTLENFIAPLREIFQRCREAGSEVIYMTPNMLNTYVADDTPPEYLLYAKKMADCQNNGHLDRYLSAACGLANEMGVPVCDCYAKWKELAKTQDTTLLLSNRINHPTPEMHELFAEALYELIMGDTIAFRAGDETVDHK